MKNIFYEHEADINDYFWTWRLHQNYTAPHFHKALELIYCVKGSMSIFIDKQHFVLQENDICFFPSYTIHSNRALDEDNVIHSFLFAHNFFHDFEKTFPQKSLPVLLLDKAQNQVFYNDLMHMFDIYGAMKTSSPDGTNKNNQRLLGRRGSNNLFCVIFHF